jgi:alpha-glucosidase (family GH31 glycosyl hydrolase)
MVNTDNPDYQYAVDNKYLIRDSRGYVRPLKWWHGSGGLVDYTNPDAVNWWHSLMDRVLDVGVDGFKCDGTDPYIMEYSLTGGALGYNDQVITYPQYAHMYYRDFLYYTREKRKADAPNNIDAGLIMSRPIDCLVDGPTKVCNPFSSKDVMFSGWVGDDDATFEGMQGCLRKTIYSAWVGYGNFGCDVGGYRGQSVSDKTLFLRWAQLGSFMSLMENGGGGEHRPWMYDEETVSIYRKFVVQHHRIAAYMHTVGANSIDQGISSMRPVDDRHIAVNTSDIAFKVVFPQPSTYSYRLGDDILVHPVMYNISEKSDIARVRMVFPTEADGSVVNWLDWWDVNNMQLAHKSGEDTEREVPLHSYAVYVREGAMLPLYDYSLNSQRIDKIDMNRVVFTWFHPVAAQATISKPKEFNMRESVTTGSGMRAEGYVNDDGSIVVELSAHNNAAGIELIGMNEPTDVTLESWETSRCIHFYQPLVKNLKVSCSNLKGGLRVKVIY